MKIKKSRGDQVLTGGGVERGLEVGVWSGGGCGQAGCEQELKLL